MKMPLQVDDVATLQGYLAGVVRRADHHADNVRDVVLPLVGAIVLFKDAERSIEVMTREGSTTNVLWAYIGGSRFAFSYDHDSRSIVLKRGTTQGNVLARFTNSTSIPEILATFETLK
jgi:hypothetical protein